MFHGTYFGFDICNPKLFTSKNRSSILPSPQNINLIQFLMIRMSKKIWACPVHVFFFCITQHVFLSLARSFCSDIWPQGMKSHVILFSRPAQAPTVVHWTHIFLLPASTNVQPRNIWHWDRNSNFPLFCHQNNKIVLWINDSGANLHGFLRRFWIRYQNKI